MPLKTSRPYSQFQDPVLILNSEFASQYHDFILENLPANHVDDSTNEPEVMGAADLRRLGGGFFCPEGG